MKNKILKIALIGPESSGKTTLSNSLAMHFNTLSTEEVARKYLEKLDRQYNQNDLLEIAIQQIKQENLLSQTANKYLFCDTELINIKIWSIWKYGSFDMDLYRLLMDNIYDHYFLCYPDLKWVPDPLRENPNFEDRLKLFNIYKNELIKIGASFTVVQGEDRLDKAKEKIVDSR